MSYEATKEALLSLFPEPPVQDGEAEGTGEENEENKKTKAKAEPRSNGLIERDYKVHGYHLDVQVDAEQLLEAVKIIDKSGFFIESITGVDWIKEDLLEVIYDFSRYDFEVCRVVVRTRVPRNSPIVPSITDIYAGANWHERETAEFFGIDFTGHPHLIPLLLPEDADFHPLLKDFKA
jgi:NADH-quinone oxidoreductase subunit C